MHACVHVCGGIALHLIIRPTVVVDTDVPLIEGLEATKAAARETTAAVEEGKRTEQAINQARETYRPQARARACVWMSDENGVEWPAYRLVLSAPQTCGEPTIRKSNQAAEGAMLYFLLTQLSAIDHMYRFSLDAFVFFFLKSIRKGEWT